MNIAILYCAKCREVLSSYGTLALSTFEQICEIYTVLDRPIRYEYDSHSQKFSLYPVIEFLEKKGWILTTEEDQEVLLIKPLGIDFFEGEFMKYAQICLQKDLHNDIDI